MPRLPGRRRFLSALAAAPLLPAALTQTAAPTPPAVPTPSPSAAPGAAEREAVADALTEAARRIFGERFPAEQAGDVKQSIVENLQAAERLRALGQGNADEPVTRFSARPPAAAKAAAAPRPRAKRP